MWRAAPHVAVFIVSPPLKTNERFPLVNIESHSGEGGGTGSVYLGVLPQMGVLPLQLGRLGANETGLSHHEAAN